METKEFKAESKRLLDLMINSIYTNKEIFLRELISNASDAMDKLYYRSLTDKNLDVNYDKLQIKIEIDKEKRILSVTDNGCGMSKEELETNLGTIAKSDSYLFKKENENKENIDIIGQFGVGFYSAFMVSDEVIVESKKAGEKEAYRWSSKGAEGYTIEECEKADYGTKVILKIKKDDENENYSQYLEQYKIEEMVKKYSDYIRFPIKMNVEHNKKKEGTENEYETIVEEEILNSQVPIWKKKKSEVKEEDYNHFYQEKFADFEAPSKVILTNAEGQYSYTALLYIPSHVPYDYYSQDYQKGLQLYSNGVLIMEKCQELIPDYYAFVKGLVDSQDLSLNISREMLQQDRQLRVIAKNIENKIKNELQNMLKNEREAYEKFYKEFGNQLKYGAYNNYGQNKENLKDLLMFYSSKDKNLTTLKEYVERMKSDQKDIYYACGESIDKIELLPQVGKVKEKEFEILYFTDPIDEFVIQVLMEYEGKNFVNVCANKLDLDTEEEKEKLNKINEENKEMLDSMKNAILGEVKEVRFTNNLKEHPVCLTSDGAISVEMQKILMQMPNNNGMKADTILEINYNHPIAEKIKKLYNNDKEKLKEYTKILYAQARLIEGLSIDNPTEISGLICDILSK